MKRAASRQLCIWGSVGTLLLLYVSSVGPVFLVAYALGLTTGTMKWFFAFYAPLEWLEDVPLIGDVLEAYIDFQFDLCGLP
jgi:hypothetical protein